MRDIVMSLTHTLYSAALCNATHWNGTVEPSSFRHEAVSLDNSRAILSDTNMQKGVENWHLNAGISLAGYIWDTLYKTVRK